MRDLVVRLGEVEVASLAAVAVEGQPLSEVRRVLYCFNEWLRRIAPARGNGRACHGMKSLPR
jgi:hypothetical protein